MTFTPQVIQVEQGTIIMKTDADANGVIRPSLYIQVIDAYRYQRELTIGLRHSDGDMKKLHWESHAYTHPNFRHVMTLTPINAQKVITRILDLANNSRILLFNDAHPLQARHEGFVHFHNLLLAGYTPSVSML
jgi:hypothetical protein